MSPNCRHCDSHQSELRFTQFSGLGQVGMSLPSTASRSGRCSWSRLHTTPMDASGESRPRIVAIVVGEWSGNRGAGRGHHHPRSAISGWNALSGPRMGPCGTRHPAKIIVDQYPGWRIQLLYRQVAASHSCADECLQAWLYAVLAALQLGQAIGIDHSGQASGHPEGGQYRKRRDTGADRVAPK
jgi:hypothetical protein